MPFTGKMPGQKKVTDTVDKPLYDTMHARMQTAKAGQMRKLRQSTVEPVIGTLVNYLGMRKVSSIGIKQANKCMLMAAVAYNLNKIMKWTNRKVNTGAMAMKKTTEKELSKLFTVIRALLMGYNKKRKIQLAENLFLL